MKHAAIAIVLTLAACGGNVDTTPIGDASPDVVDELAPSHCYTPADPFKEYDCDAAGVTCSCPSCFVVDAGAGECK